MGARMDQRAHAPARFPGCNSTIGPPWMCQRAVPHSPQAKSRTTMAARRLSRRHQQILQWLAADHQRTRGIITSSHQDLIRALAGDKGNISHSLATLEARGLIIISRSPGGKAE